MVEAAIPTIVLLFRGNQYNKSVMGHQDHVSVVYFNVRSLFPKIDNLRPICASMCPSFVCVVETWLSSETDDSEICIQGYTTIRLDRCRHGSGLVIYVLHLLFCSKGALILNILCYLVNHP